MLQNFLTGLRKQRTIGAARAVQQLKGWNVSLCVDKMFKASGESKIQKEFKFESFEEASNFILRYTQYCQKINVAPTW